MASTALHRTCHFWWPRSTWDQDMDLYPGNLTFTQGRELLGQAEAVLDSIMSKHSTVGDSRTIGPRAQHHPCPPPAARCWVGVVPLRAEE